METGEGEAHNRLEGWKQVRVRLRTVWRDGNRKGWGPEPSGGMETGEGGHRTVWRDGNK
jgi:hypothetical protein